MNVRTIAERLADEGVPLCAIARSVRIPSQDLREHLAAARDDGRLLDLPKEDWPPGFPRDERAAELSRKLVCDRGALLVAARQLFGLTVAEAELLLMLVQLAVVRSSNVTCVRIHHLRRRLATFGITVTTLWGCGYRLSGPDRRKAIDLILAYRADDVAPPRA